MALAGSVLLGAVAGLIWVAVAPTPLLREIATSDVFFHVIEPASDKQPVRQASVQGVGQ